MFGARVAERLARDHCHRVVIAGRSGEKARAAASTLAARVGSDVEHAPLDASAPDRDGLARLKPRVVVNASGPFQAQDYALARAAIAVGAHYVDLADARAFVVGISALDQSARAAGVLVTSGASSVPALAAAIIDAELDGFGRLERIEHGITPASGYDPGLATTVSIIGGVGKPMQVWRDGGWQTAHAWQGLERVAIPGLGHRWMSRCDVPDLTIFPARYAGVETVEFKAGLDVPVFQLGLWLLAAFVRAGAVRHADRLASPLTRVKQHLRFLGGTSGGLVVRLTGYNRDGQPRRRTIGLVVRDNEGPHVPAIPPVVVARKLLSGALKAQGATACVGFMTLDEFKLEATGLPLDIIATDG